MNRDVFDTAQNIAGVIGKAFHKAMEVYYGGSDTLIVGNESQAIEYGLMSGMEYLESYNDGFINYSKTIPNKQKAFDIFAFCFNSYVKEQPYVPNELIEVEDKIVEQINVEWRGERLVLPVKLKGYIDKTHRKDGKLCMTDYKVVGSFSNPDKIDGAKILAAVEYYLLCYAKYGEEPYSITFEEIKRTKNADGSKQVKSYEVVFADNPLYFDFYFRFYEDMTRALNGEMVYVPNVDTIYDNEIAIIAYIHRLDITEETAKLMKKHRVQTLTELLKKEIQSAGNMRKLLKSIEDDLVEAKNIDYNSMQNHEKIQTKLMEHGMLLKFDSFINGATVDLYQYTPSIGLKMSRLRNYADDIEQVLGTSGVRVLAPIPGTSLVGFEVPRKERVFPEVPSGDTGFEIAIGQTIMGTPRYFDIRTAPHLLIAGSAGSGKSVFLSAIIPQLAKVGQLYLFDPKIVELAHFEHLGTKYETDGDRINEVLGDLVKEMEDRYKALAKLGKKNIEGTDIPYIFPIIDEFGDLTIQNPEGSTKWQLCKEHRDEDKHSRGALTQLLQKNPSKLRVKEQEAVDQVVFCEKCKKVELASFEQNILRLAAKGRAAGIHLIIATQSPRVDVIKGSIKANFPTKVVFKTAKAIDSVVVLDEPGAEKLLGKGDMLFAGNGAIERLQGYAV